MPAEGSTCSVSDFQNVALIQNHSTSKVTAVENRGQILAFLTPCKN